MVSVEQPVVVRQSRAKLALGLLGCLLFLAMAVFLWSRGVPRGMWGAVAVYFGIPVFGFFALVYLVSLVNPGTLTLSSQGLEAKQVFGTLRLAWPQIADAQTTSAGFISPVAIRLTEGKAKTLTTLWEKPPQELARLIREHRDRWTTPATATPAPSPGPTNPAIVT